MGDSKTITIAQADLWRKYECECGKPGLYMVFVEVLGNLEERCLCDVCYENIPNDNVHKR